MQRILSTAIAAGLLASSGAAVVSARADERIIKNRDSALTAAFAATTRSTPWEQVQKLSLDFPTYHPQGFALVGDRIFMSTVEILEPTVRYPTPVDGYDRTPGKGVGHVLVMDRAGKLLRDVVLGEGDIYHPGGIDFDGESVWVPVAEYRPNSAAIIYRLDPNTYEVSEQFRVADHIGGVVRDQVSGQLHGVSWGSRTMYTWTLAGRELSRVANIDHMLDYQDCAYADFRKQICSGVTVLPAPDGGRYELGGLVLRDLRDGEILHQVPFPYFSSAKHSMTRNPVALEVDASVLRLFAAPDDQEYVMGTELLVFEAPLP